MSTAAGQLSHQPSRSWSLLIGLGVGAIVVLMLAMFFGGLLIGPLTFAGRQAETTGFGNSTMAAPEPEIDGMTGAPLTHLRPGDLATGSEALKHPAPMRKVTSLLPPRTSSSVKDVAGRSPSRPKRRAMDRKQSGRAAL